MSNFDKELRQALVPTINLMKGVHSGVEAQDWCDGKEGTWANINGTYIFVRVDAEAVKKAFKKGGWVNLIDGVATLAATGQLPHSKTYALSGDGRSQPTEVMTGQEWFKKFSDELKNALVAYPEDGDEESAMQEYWRICEIAKKASGIK